MHEWNGNGMRERKRERERDRSLSRRPWHFYFLVCFGTFCGCVWVCVLFSMQNCHLTNSCVLSAPFSLFLSLYVSLFAAFFASLCAHSFSFFGGAFIHKKHFGVLGPAYVCGVLSLCLSLSFLQLCSWMCVCVCVCITGVHAPNNQQLQR